MKLKFDDDGHVVIQDDMPVYVDDDGNDVPFNAGEAMKKIRSLNAEAKDHRVKKEEALENLKVFEGIDPKAALKALATVKNLDDKKLVDAGEVDTLKKQLSESYEADKKLLLDTFTKEKGEFTTTLASKDETIRHLLISNNFAKSPWFAGEKPKTILPPDIAAEYFGKFFEVQGEGPEAKIVGKLNGEMIMATVPERIGEPATFEEAMTKIIENFSDKDSILRATPGGPDSNGNLNFDRNARVITLSNADSKDPMKYRAAKKAADEQGIPMRIAG